MYANNNSADDNDSGDKGDQLTRNSAPSLNGTGEAGATVTVTLKDTTAGRGSPLADVVLTSVLVGSDGRWSVAVPGPLGDGQWTPSMVVTDIAGNAADAVDGTPFTVDALAPSGQTGALAAASDSGNGVAGTDSDQRTSQNKPVLEGTAEAGAKVKVSLVDGANTYTYTTTADGNGAWRIVVSDALSDAIGGTSYTPVIEVTDKAGNSSTVNGTPFVVDRVALHRQHQRRLERAQPSAQTAPH
jgi:hypothetical protein